jgi:hypothetical protein
MSGYDQYRGSSVARAMADFRALEDENDDWADIAEVEYDDFAENEYDDAAAEAYQLARDVKHEQDLLVGPAASCRFYFADYCAAHDYDHVLARREQDDFNARWIEMKNEFGRYEAEQEAAAFMRGLDR